MSRCSETFSKKLDRVPSRGRAHATKPASKGPESLKLIVGLNKVIVGVRCVLKRLQPPSLAAVRLVMGKARKQYGAVLRLRKICWRRRNGRNIAIIVRHRISLTQTQTHSTPRIAGGSTFRRRETEHWDRLVRATECTKTPSLGVQSARINWLHSSRHQLH